MNKKLQKIYVVGDIHGYFGYFNNLLNHLNNTDEGNSIILQTGDFGYWPKLQNQVYNGKTRKRIWDQYAISNKNIKIYWCEGNHEDLPALYASKTNEYMKNIFWMKRKSVLILPNGKSVMFLGGAKSIDWQYRIEGKTWFREEVISNEDIENLPDIHIDIMITHTAPVEFDEVTKGDHFFDQSRYMLSEVLKKYQPKKWFFGHFHKFVQGKYENTEWTCLADICSMEKWYIELQNRGENG
jgi:predicted phosphodiesterase